MAKNNYDKGTEYAETFEQFIADCKAGKKVMPLKADGTIHKSNLAKELGFKQRSTFAQNERCAELMVQAEKDFNHKTKIAEIVDERSETVKRLERNVARLEKRVADLLVENASLRSDQKRLDFRDSHRNKTGWLVEHVND
ncbi:MAG: hypothetical protein ABW072_17455 [Sedimenticola sp.]